MNYRCASIASGLIVTYAKLYRTLSIVLKVPDLGPLINSFANMHTNANHKTCIKS